MNNKIKAKTSQILFDVYDNKLALELFGERDCNLRYIEKAIGVNLKARGNRVIVEGKNSQKAIDIFNVLLDMVKERDSLGSDEVDAAIRLSNSNINYSSKNHVINTPKKKILARSLMQAKYIDSLKNYDLTFGLGPAGTGKTYLAVATAAEYLAIGEVDKIILSRPAVEAGEHLGFLPGDLKDKVDPYLRPLYDALGDCMNQEKMRKFIDFGKIEIAPLAFMRGRTLSDSFIILDEAQNTTPMQMKMFLTRIGNGSRMAITGDLTQVDLPPSTKSGLLEAVKVTSNIREISQVSFSEEDVVRNPLVTSIVKSYDKYRKK